MTLPSVVRSGRTEKRSCAPPRRDAEAGHHLVEDEQRAVLAPSERRRPCEVAVLGRDEAACSPTTGSTITAAIFRGMHPEDLPQRRRDR
jgi:hypothetical protein